MNILTWNLQSPSEKRAQYQLEYLNNENSDIYILTELKIGRGFDTLVSGLMMLGYNVVYSRKANKFDYITIIASKYRMYRSRLDVSDADPRSCLVDIYSNYGCITVFGLYMPSYHPKFSSHEKFTYKKNFQESIENLLSNYFKGPSTRLVLGGDLNVMEPNHIPCYADFSLWSKFYQYLKHNSMLDAYREIYPDKIEHSWFSPQGEQQRIDHFFVDNRMKRSIIKCCYDHSVRLNALSDHSAMKLVIFDE